MARKAKTEKFHSEAEEAVYELLQEAIKAHHPHFDKSVFLILFKHGGYTSKGRPVFAKFKVLGDDLRRALKKDAILYLNCDAWRKMGSPQHRYFLDEALYGLEFKSNAQGEELYHADGRPLLKTVPPDIEAYIDVVKRHVPVAEGIKTLLRGLKDVSQLSIDDVQDEVPALPHEGVKVTVDSGGVVQEVEDNNQVTWDQAIDNDPIPFDSPEPDDEDEE